MHLDALLLAASERLGKPFSLTVHLGAGSGAPDLYASLPCTRLVLVEGEPAVAEELRGRCGARLPAAEVEQAVVAPATGPVTWHQYNLRPLSGPVDALALRAWYPRLEQTGMRQVQAVALATWLEGVTSASLPEPEDQQVDAASSLLVFDLPGQESALLDALPDDRLRRFGWVVVRRWRQGGAAAGADAVRERLARAGFDRVLPAASEAGAQIVQELYRFDEHQDQLRRLAQDRDETRARASGLEQALAATRQSLQDVDVRRAQAEAALDDSRSREAQLAGEVAALTSRQQELEAIGRRQSQLAADAQARVARLDTERAELQRLCETLRAELRAAEAARDESTGQRRQAERSLTERQARETELSSRIATLESRHAALTSSAERGAQAAREAEARAAQIDAERSELRQRSGELRGKLQAAEASLADLGRRHQEADALARSRALELEVAQKQLAEERKNGRTQAQRIEKLEAELLDAQFRLETLQHELLKAEGQLEVVKDLLLNETTL